MNFDLSKEIDQIVGGDTGPVDQLADSLGK